MGNTIFVFDLDGTITAVESLPRLAKALGISEQMDKLTKMTLEGQLDFKASFRRRVEMLRPLPLEKAQQVMAELPLNEEMVEFIQQHRNQCFVITANLDVWIEPIMQRLGCNVFSSKAKFEEDGSVTVDSIVDKKAAISFIKTYHPRVVAIGDSTNDIPMFKAADVSIAYGGVHDLTVKIKEHVDYIIKNSEEMASLLNRLNC